MSVVDSYTKMRRNVLISSRLCARLFCNHAIKDNFLPRCVSQYKENKIPKLTLTPARFYSQATPTKCWSCQKPTNNRLAGTKDSFFCSNCGSLQEAEKNYVRERTYENILSSLCVVYRTIFRCLECLNKL